MLKHFNMITNKDKAKSVTEHILCDFKCTLDSTTCKSKQKWNNKTCQLNVKIVIGVKKIIV